MTTKNFFFCCGAILGTAIAIRLWNDRDVVGTEHHLNVSASMERPCYLTDWFGDSIACVNLRTDDGDDITFTGEEVHLLKIERESGNRNVLVTYKKTLRKRVDGKVWATYKVLNIKMDWPHDRERGRSQKGAGIARLRFLF